MTANNASGSRPKVSIIIPARRESAIIANVIGQSRQIRHGSETIVVCDSSTNNTAKIARSAGATKVLLSNGSLGYNQGRSVGAGSAAGDILLFVPAESITPSSLLSEYVDLVEEGWDLVLNGGSSSRLQVHAARSIFNYMLGRPDLAGGSLISAPFALSRRALEAIGTEKLSVPPLAQAAAIVRGLKVTSFGSMNSDEGNSEQAMQHVLGDHAEAISYLTSCRGERGGMTDYGRRRDIISLPLQDYYIKGGSGRG